MKVWNFGGARVAPLMLSLLAVGSCNSTETPKLAEDLLRQQSAQQRSLTEQSKALSESSGKLVEADSKSRKELVELQSRVQTQIEAQRQVVQQQRDSLEEERRAIATQRHRDPLVAGAIMQAVTLAIAALPIFLLILIIRSMRNEPNEFPLADVLITDLASEQPLLIPLVLRDESGKALSPPELQPRLEQEENPVDDAPDQNPLGSSQPA